LLKNEVKEKKDI